VIFTLEVSLAVQSSFSFCSSQARLHLPVCAFLLSAAAAPFLAQALASPPQPNGKIIARKFDLLNLRFEPNDGQSGSNAKFLGHGRGFSALFKQTEADFRFAGHSSAPGLLRVTLLGASKNTAIAGEKRLPGTVNYFVGSDPEKWHSGLPTYAQLRCSSVYPKTDLIYYGNDGNLEFDFRLSPGAAPKHIQMRFQGAQKLSIDAQGNLIVTASEGHLKFQRPVIYQPGAGGRRLPVKGSFRIGKSDTVGFVIGNYDHTRPLVIDPILNYSTYVGALASATAIAVDQNGEAYVTGIATPDFPTTPGSYQPVGVPYPGGNVWPADGKPFVAKLNSTGTALLYSTFLSGSGVDSANRIALDANGDAFVVGSTSSTDFPVTTGALQTKNKASQTTGYVAELNSTGSSLLYSTYLGGGTSTTVDGVAIDGSGNAYLTGSTDDIDFPTTTGAYRTTPLSKTVAGSNSAFVAKLNPAGTALLYATYLGGSQQDAASSIAIDSAGEAFVGGGTTSTDFPVTPGVVQGAREAKNNTAGFIAKFNASGSALVYSTFLSGNSSDYVSSIALDSNANVYATGSTTSPDFPVTSGAFQPNIGYTSFGYPQANAYVTELNNTGTSLIYSTFLGGGISLGPYADEGDQAAAIAVDPQGMVYLTGEACTGNFPVTLGAFEPQNLDGEINAECTGFLTKLNPVPDTPLVYSTFLGGTGNGDAIDYFVGEAAAGLAIDSSNNVYIAGFTLSVDFPITAGVFETPFTGPSEEAFVTEFNGSEMKFLPIPTVTLTSNTSSVLFGQPVTFTATVKPFSGNTTPTGYVGFNFFTQEASDNQGLGIGFGPWTTVPLNAAAAASFTTSSLVALQTYVNAFYLGDANNAPASGSMTQDVTDIATVTTVTANQNNVPYGTPVVFTATVLDSTGKPAKGFVFFLLGNLSYAETNLDASGRATWTNTTGGPPLPVGTDTVTVQFSPYTGYQQSSGTLGETFTPLGTTPDPTLTPPAGTYNSQQQVNLGDSNSFAVVYFTTDGSTPVPGVSLGFPAGTFTLAVNQSETVNAIAVAPGYSLSNMISAPYSIDLVPDFSLDIAFPQMAINAGGSGSSAVTVYEVNNFNGSVVFSCSGLPAGVTCTFAPASVTGYGNSTLTVAASASAAVRDRFPSSGPVSFALLAAALGLVRIGRRRIWSLALFAFCLALGAVNGCGGGGSTSTSTGPITTTYSVNVTGTSGSLTHSALLTLSVTK
jgi:hypothetical protein